jgi:hypothetical protein
MLYVAFFAKFSSSSTVRARAERLFGKLMEFSFFSPEVPSSIF